MGGVELLDEARRAGLTVKADGGKLVIRGAHGAEAIAKRLMNSKQAVMAALLVDGEWNHSTEIRGGRIWHVSRRRGESIYLWGRENVPTPKPLTAPHSTITTTPWLKTEE